MSSRVSIEFTSISEALVAHGALEGSFPRVPSEMGHVSLVSHEALVAVVASEGEVAGVPALMPDKFVAIAELLLAVFAGIPFSILVYPRMFGEMLTLSEALVADFANEGLGWHRRSFHRCRHFALDDGGSLAQGVTLAFPAGLAHGRCYLYRDPVPFCVSLPHGVRVVDEEVAVGQRARHPDELESVGVKLEAGACPGHSGDRDDRIAGAGHRSDHRRDGL